MATSASLRGRTTPATEVRLTSFEELKRRTGQDFDYLPWADDAERERAILRWQSWWEGRKPALARPREMP